MRRRRCLNFYQAFDELTQTMRKQSFELILIDDGSKDGTLTLMLSLAARDTRVRYLSFSRNFGKEAANFCRLACG